MAQPFESMVRPFQLPINTPARPALAPNEQVDSNAPIFLFIGKNAGIGSVKTFNGTAKAIYTFYCDQAIVEQDQ